MLRICALLCFLSLASAMEPIYLVNPLRSDQEQVPIRVYQGERFAGSVAVDGAVVPSQWEESPQGSVLWALVNLSGGQRARVSPHAESSDSVETSLAVEQEGDFLLLRNEHIAVRIPGPESDGLSAPIQAIRYGEGPWIGQGQWHNPPDLADYTVRVEASGPVQITVLQDYSFRDGSQLRLRLRLRPGRDILEVEERISLPDDTAWSFDPLAGSDWGAHQSLFTRHGGGAGQPINENVQTGTLQPGQSRMGDTLVFLLPRWSQAMDDGWMAAAASENMAVGMLTVRAGQWKWPHDGKVAVELAPGGDRLRLRLPGIYDGARMWWLRAAPRDAWETDELRRMVMHHAMADLDKLNQMYILDGFEKGTSGLPHPFRGASVNPTGMWRQQARRDFSQHEGREGSFGDLVWSQGALDPDFYGTPWYGWSVQNPNFWSDILQRPVLRLSRLGEHPRFEEIRQLALLSMRADLYHSVTLPGGAGQECPGYQRHANGVWRRLAEHVSDALGEDMREWERFEKSESFLVRSSQPDGGRHRRMIPHGDTHPTGDGPRRVELGDYDPTTWVSEEFPGFGAILRNNAGTDQETFVAFKGGPNRGHYHGDQLSLHWAHNARPLMVDHHVSYSPRAGQEHMHNRLSFGTDDMPWAVMDGHERMLAFATHERADVAIAEVDSPRLRRMPKLPPEEWDQRWDTHELGGTLSYRRAVVLLKDVAGSDALVLMDSWQGPEELITSFNAHVLASEAQDQGQQVTFDDRLTIYRAWPVTAEFERFDWSHDRGGGESTVGLRWSVRAASGRMITVLWPGDAMPEGLEAITDGVRIGDATVRFGSSVDGGSGDPVLVQWQGEDVLRIEAVEKERHQGDIGIFVPDAGYPFGPMPRWLAEQRLQRPDWAEKLPRLLDPMEEW